MRLLRALSAIGMAGLVCGATQQEFWQVGRTETGASFAMVLGDDGSPMLRFECTAEDVVASVYGATHQLDPDSGEEIGDAPGSEMKGSAAQMALITDTVNAHWIWAEAVPHAGVGWDLTIRLPFDHPGLSAFPRAKMIGLVAPGGGTVSVVEKGDRLRLAGFLRSCRAGSEVR
jgi:hypothetical protein